MITIKCSYSLYFCNLYELCNSQPWAIETHLPASRSCFSCSCSSFIIVFIILAGKAERAHKHATMRAFHEEDVRTSEIITSEQLLRELMGRLTLKVQHWYMWGTIILQREAFAFSVHTSNNNPTWRMNRLNYSASIGILLITGYTCNKSSLPFLKKKLSIVDQIYWIMSSLLRFFRQWFMVNTQVFSSICVNIRSFLHIRKNRKETVYSVHDSIQITCFCCQFAFNRSGNANA